MLMPTRLALILLAAPALLAAQAPAPAAVAAATPTFSQRYKAGKAEVEKLMEAFEFREALTKAEALLPPAAPVFDKSSANGAHNSTWDFIEMSQAYALAFRAADGAGQWEKGRDYLTKAIALGKLNQESGKEQLTLHKTAWAERAAAVKAKLDLNAGAIKELKAKGKLEDYEEESMARVKDWEKEFAEGEKWSKFFQYDMDMAVRDTEYNEKVAGVIDRKLASQKDEIDAYKPHPGDKLRWTEAVIATRSYMDAIPDKQDKIALLYRLTVLDPENKKVEHELDVQLGKAAPTKDTRPAPRKTKK